MQLAPEILQLIADHHAFCMEKRESRAFLLDTEQIEFLAQFSVVAASRFLQHRQISVQVSFLFKRCSVNPLQHLVLFAATPIGAGKALQLQRLDPTGRRQMGTGAQIGEITLCI